MSAEESFAINLKLLRTESRRTQAYTAKTLGVSLATYRNWEYGSFTPKIAKLRSICQHYQVSAQSMLSQPNFL
jgi:transcriptional regulator with XRE-family HTH domain